MANSVLLHNITKMEVEYNKFTTSDDGRRSYYVTDIKITPEVGPRIEMTLFNDDPIVITT